MNTRLEWGLWLYGLGSAFIGGGAGGVGAAIGAAILDPTHFNVLHPGPLLLLMASTFAASGVTPFFAYLKQYPLPSLVTETETKTTRMQANPPAIIEQTVRTTETKPVEEAPK